MALPNNASGFGANFDPSNPFGADFSGQVPAEDSSWIGRLTFKVHDETLKHVTPEGDRLIKKVTAYREDGTEYWTQAFYRSTGSNSKFPGFWFPFLGISMKDGKKYYSKDISLPSGWPAEDRLKLKKQLSELGVIRADTRELADRFLARSFLLGANAISALLPDKDQRASIMERMFDSALQPQAVDSTLAEIITQNDGFKDFKEDYNNIMPSSDKTVNMFIGRDIYINYDNTKSVNLSSFNGLPNYNKNLRGGYRRRSIKKRSSIKKRLTRRSRHRKGLNKKH